MPFLFQKYFNQFFCDLSKCSLILNYDNEKCNILALIFEAILVKYNVVVVLLLTASFA